jgi:prevent-host-death family protein
MAEQTKTINLRDANQQFSRLVREVQETGREYIVMRNGEEAVRISPARNPSERRKLSPEQQAALDSMFELAERVRGKSSGRKLTRDELHER